MRAWWPPNRPSSASRSSPILRRNEVRARSARTAGSLTPAMRPSIICRVWLEREALNDGVTDVRSRLVEHLPKLVDSVLLGVALADILEQHAEQPGREQAEAQVVDRPGPHPTPAGLAACPMRQEQQANADGRADDGEERELPTSCRSRARPTFPHGRQARRPPPPWMPWRWPQPRTQLGRCVSLTGWLVGWSPGPLALTSRRCAGGCSRLSRLRVGRSNPSLRR